MSQQIAKITDDWIDDLAARAKMPRIAYLRVVRTRAHLSRAIAAALIEDCTLVAARLLAEKQRPPAGDDTRAVLTRAAYYRLRDARDRSEMGEQKAELDRLRAEQR